MRNGLLHLRLAKRLLGQGLLSGRPLFQLCLGVPWGMEATVENLVHFRGRLPEDALWSAFGVGAAEYPMAAAATIMEGHIRVGFEDNVYLSKGILAESNAQLVRKAVQLAELLDREIASPKEAKVILGLE